MKRFRYLFLLLSMACGSFLHAQQPDYDRMDEELFYSEMGGGGWHPQSHDSLLFNGAFSIVLSRTMSYAQYNITIQGLDPETKQRYEYKGTCTARFENRFFELKLEGEDVQKVAKYITGYLIKHHVIRITDSENPLVLNDDLLKTGRWYVSRR